MSTQIIPTDKYGNVYYGPKTFDKAMEDVNRYFDESGLEWAAAVDKVADMLENHGYANVAKKVRAEKV